MTLLVRVACSCFPVASWELTTAFIAGELPYDGCCGNGHNGYVNQLPDSIPNTRIVSAQGLATYPAPSGDFAGQRLHFDVGAQRELGRRYANAFLQTIAD